MADEDKSGTNLASGSVIFVALVSAGLYFFHREAPLVDTRPGAEQHYLESHAPPQEIEARLWQDPIGAVDEFREKKSGAWEAEQDCRYDTGVIKSDICKLPLDPHAKRTMVLAVTVPGAPYPEDVERRRRTRYAVLAGLGQADFAPVDRRHIGYFVWAKSSSAAFFLSETLRDLSLAKRALPLLACDVVPPDRFDCVSPQPAHLATAAPLFGLLQAYNLNNVRAQPESRSADLVIVPYERFKRAPGPARAKQTERAQAEEPDSILVLWLKEDALMSQPLTALNALAGLLNKNQQATLKFIGPFSSDLALEMVNEALEVNYQPNHNRCDINGSPWKNLKREKNVKFYAYGVSAPDRYLFDRVPHNCDSLRDYFARLGIDLQRTTATDDTLAKGILDELLLRRIDPRPSQNSGHEDHIALISEWDTLYGQTLPKSVARTFAPDVADPKWIHKFTYLRGLDGLLPSSPGKQDTKQDKSTTAGEKQASAPDFFKIETDTQGLERPIGESQYDYLRRISGHLHKIDHELRKEEHEGTKEVKRIKAIGILGGDVFDKLLILRALRPEFPEAVFFTTGFDEAFTIKSELPFTRNLIISSSFGPNLSDWLQGDIPFFRDSVETSAFLATRLAIGHLGKDLETPSAFPPDLSKQLLTPRLFEVTRTGGIIPFAWKELSAPPETPSQNHERKPEDSQVISDLTQGRSVASCPVGGDVTCGLMNPIVVTQKPAPAPEPCWKSDDAKSCGYIQPVVMKELQKPGNQKVIEKLFPTYEEKNRITLAASLAAGALIALGIVFGSRYVREHFLFETILLILGLGIGSITCFNWESFAQFMTQHGEGAPLSILEGVSVWPTILLRALGIVLSLYFIYRALRGLHENLAEEIADKMELSPKPETWLQQLAGFKKDFLTFKRDILGFLRAVWKGLSSLFHSPRPIHQKPQNEALDVEAVWREYVCHERVWMRCFRAALYALGMFSFGMFVLVPMFGKPTPPVRGDLAYYAYKCTVFIDAILMLCLMFLIFDATLSCLLFVNKLRNRTQWPQTTAGLYEGRLKLQTNLVNDWIGLEFVAKRTKCIGSLIYFPFIMIALLILSRSTIFANYAPSLTILIWFGISLSIVFGCAVMLWWGARETSDIAKKNMTEGIISEKEAEGDPRLAEQLETLLIRVGQLKEGAFRPLSQQPLVRAFLFPLSSAGWVALVQSGMLPGL